MRLINADTYLKKVCAYNETGCGSCRFQTKCPADEPTIDAEPVRHGKWKDIRCGIGTCSECGDRYGSVDVMNYCPYCGARMDLDFIEE